MSVLRPKGLPRSMIAFGSKFTGLCARVRARVRRVRACVWVQVRARVYVCVYYIMDNKDARMIKMYQYAECCSLHVDVEHDLQLFEGVHNADMIPLPCEHHLPHVSDKGMEFWRINECKVYILATCAGRASELGV